jgi:hypothetical protein
VDGDGRHVWRACGDMYGGRIDVWTGACGGRGVGTWRGRIDGMDGDVWRTGSRGRRFESRGCFSFAGAEEAAEGRRPQRGEVYRRGAWGRGQRTWTGDVGGGGEEKEKLSSRALGSGDFEAGAGGGPLPCFSLTFLRCSRFSSPLCALSLSQPSSRDVPTVAFP